MKIACIALLLASFTAAAQAPNGQPAAPGAPGANPQQQHMPVYGLNEKEGVSVDRFIGRPSDNPVHWSHGTLMTQAILEAGDPYHPGPQGDVLEYRKLLATAQLLPGSQTPLETYPDEYMFYVQSGQGRLDDGKQYWDLSPDIAILVPPGVPHRFVNTSQESPLKMVMLQWTAGPDAKHELIVRNTRLLPWCEENAHWNNGSRCIFGQNDGLLPGERIYSVMLPPRTVSQPHPHTPGTEEIWTLLTPEPVPVLLGSDLRELQQDDAYLVPPNGKTDHSNYNFTGDKMQWYLYIARGPARPNQPPRPMRIPPEFANNPNLSRDTTAATVPGKPLQ